MPRRSLPIALGAALAFGLAAGAQATPVTVSFAGTVTFGDEGSSLTDGSIATGSPLTGTFSYDPALLTDSDPDPMFGVYAIDPASFSLTLSIGSYTVVFDPAVTFFGSLYVDNDQPGPSEDQHGFSLDDGIGGFESLGTILFSGFSLGFKDPTMTAVASDSLVGIPYTPAAWEPGDLQIDLSVETEPGVTEDLFLAGKVSIVPEPSALLLLASALLVPRMRR